MTVIDASALVAYCLNETGLDRARLKEHLAEGLTSIELIRAESANAIVVATRRGIVDEKTARSALKAMLELSKNNIEMVPLDVELVSEAFDRATSGDLAIYDLLYILVAKHQDAGLLTRDDRQMSAAKKLGIRTEKA